jgi:hypothetical protein
VSHDHGVSNLTALFASWSLFVSSLATNALPVVQIIALIFSIVASVYVIKKNRA